MPPKRRKKYEMTIELEVEFDADSDEEAQTLGFWLEWRLAGACGEEPYEHLSSAWGLEQVVNEPRSPLGRKVIRRVDLDDDLLERLENEAEAEEPG